MHEGKQPIANLITTAAVRDGSWEDWLELGEMEWKMGCGKMARQVSEQLAQKRLCGQAELTWQEGQ